MFVRERDPSNTSISLPIQRTSVVTADQKRTNSAYLKSEQKILTVISPIYI